MNKKRGFTLMELLTVVIILSILSAVAIPQYTKVIQRADAVNALISLKTIYESAKRYNSSYGAWPTSLDGLDVKLLLNEDSQNQSGKFEYSFDAAHKIASACRVVGSSAENAYCLQAQYKKPGAAKKDTYSCLYLSAKYQPLCESMGACPEGNNECPIR